MKKQFDILIENNGAIKQIIQKKTIKQVGKLFRKRVH